MVEDEGTFCLGMNRDGRGVAANFVGLFDLYFHDDCDDDAGVSDGTETEPMLFSVVAVGVCGCGGDVTPAV